MCGQDPYVRELAHLSSRLTWVLWQQQSKQQGTTALVLHRLLAECLVVQGVALGALEAAWCTAATVTGVCQQTVAT
jgi:hypothetical protein